MNLRGIISLASLALLGTTVAYGHPREGDSILDLRLERESIIGQCRRAYYTSGAATMHFADSTSFSTAALTADISKLDDPVTVQEGSGHNRYGLTAESTYKLSPVSTVWGHAGYQRRKTRDISLCDVTGYETIAPFVAGDDTGGDLSSQQYDFGGGWDRVYGAWTLGVEADYSAAVAHRATDPRVRNIVSDLNVGIGGAHRIGLGYWLGVNCGVRIYHQDTDVDFYNPTTHAITMVFTGLGSTASRFKGADAQSTTHRLTGFNATLQLVPVRSDDSFYASVTADLTGADLILDGYSNLKFGSTSTRTIGGSLSRAVTIRAVTLFPTVKGYYRTRTATENLFGSSAENYEKIGQRENYHHDCSSAIIGIPAAWHLKGSRATITLDLQAGYIHDKEYLVEPSRSLTTGSLISSVTLEATKRLGSHWAVGLETGYHGRAVKSTSAVWGGLDLTSAIGEMTLHNYRMASCDINALHGGVTVSRSLRTSVVSFSARYERSDYRHLNKGQRFVTNLSLSF